MTLALCYGILRLESRASKGIAHGLGHVWSVVKSMGQTTQRQILRITWQQCSSNIARLVSRMTILPPPTSLISHPTRSIACPISRSLIQIRLIRLPPASPKSLSDKDLHFWLPSLQGSLPDPSHRFAEVQASLETTVGCCSSAWCTLIEVG